MLKTFVVATSTGSISKTAQMLRYSESTVWYHIREIEKSSGSLLFDREVRGLSLTREGKEIQDLARELLKIIDAIEKTRSTASPVPVRRAPRRRSL